MIQLIFTFQLLCRVIRHIFHPYKQFVDVSVILCRDNVKSIRCCLEMANQDLPPTCCH